MLHVALARLFGFRIVLCVVVAIGKSKAILGDTTIIASELSGSCCAPLPKNIAFARSSVHCATTGASRAMYFKGAIAVSCGCIGVQPSFSIAASSMHAA